MIKDSEQIICSKCGRCCKLFLINLNEREYLSGAYETVFGDIETFSSFAEAEKYGAMFLAQNEDGSCIYLSKGECSIHERRPSVCRKFFCQGKEPEFADMRKAIRTLDNSAR